MNNILTKYKCSSKHVRYVKEQKSNPSKRSFHSRMPDDYSSMECLSVYTKSMFKDFEDLKYHLDVTCEITTLQCQSKWEHHK